MTNLSEDRVYGIVESATPRQDALRADPYYQLSNRISWMVGKAQTRSIDNLTNLDFLDRFATDGMEESSTHRLGE